MSEYESPIKVQWKGKAREKFESRLERSIRNEKSTIKLLTREVFNRQSTQLVMRDEREAAAVSQYLDSVGVYSSKAMDAKSRVYNDLRNAMWEKEWDRGYDFDSEDYWREIDIIVRKVDGEHRIGFPEWDPDEVSLDVLMMVSEKAKSRFSISRLSDGCKIGSILIQDGEYEHVDWKEYEFIHPPDEGAFQHGLSEFVTPPKETKERFEIQIWNEEV